MPALTKSDYTATITWLGRVPDRDASLRAAPVDSVHAALEGFEGEAHSGLSRASCVRFTMLYPKGTQVRNTRQLSILSAEELAGIAADIDLETLDPALLGASMVVAGVPDFSHIPVGTRLKSAGGAVITIDLENGPCNWPGKEIEADHPGHGKGFKTAAMNRRGVTAWIEREGALSVGEALEVFVPTQPNWHPV